jgi:hypothetical protein
MRIAFLLLALGFPTRPEPTDPILLHVAPDGSDSASGTELAPLATLEGARDALRVIRAASPRRPAIIELHAGAYRLARPLVLTPEDSGSAEAPVTYRARAGDRVVLSGAVSIPARIESIDGRATWVADLPDLVATFHNLWVGDRRAVRARHPNLGAPLLTVESAPGVTPDSPLFPGTRDLIHRPGDLPALNDPGIVDLWLYHYWLGERLAVESYEPDARRFRFVANARMRLVEGFGDTTASSRYHVEGAREFLDAPGEFWLDSRGRRLLYLPRDGESTETTPLHVPITDQLLRLEGDPAAGRNVEHVRFEGLTFAHTEWWPARDDTLGDQAAVHVPAAIEWTGAVACRIERCTLRNLGTYGLALGAGCRDNVVARSTFTDLAAGGIKIGETTIRPDGPLRTCRNAVEDCLVEAGGRVFPQAVGVWIGQSGDNRIEHNTIRDLFYTGISLGWTWGYDESLAAGNLVARNLVHNIGQGLLSDLAGIYTLGDHRGTTIRDNVFRDIAAHNYGGWGIYYDEGTTGIVAEGNLVLRTTHGGFHQHYGRDNVFRNNLIAFGRDGQIQRTRLEPHRSFTFERNIVLWDRGPLLVGDWSQRNADFDHNLYGRRDGTPIDFAGKDWDAWRAAGADVHSVLANPCLADPARDDAVLSGVSPALGLGFIPLDIGDVGPRTTPGAEP